jgi:hypothetical protein
MIEVSANIGGMWTWTRVSELSCDPHGWAATSFYRPRGGDLQLCRVSYCTVSWYRCWGIRDRALRTQNDEIVVVKQGRVWRSNGETPEAI